MPGKTRLAKVARITAKIAAGLIALVFLFIFALFLANSFDVPLSKQAKDLLIQPPNPYPPGDNIYLAMAGLEGPGERSITEMGQERIDAYNAAFDSMLNSPELPQEFNKKWESTKLTFAGKLNLGPQRTTSIWSDTKTHRQDISALLAGNQELYQRYLSLHRMHGYYETARPSYSAPAIFVPQPVRVLFLADVANRIQTGSLQRECDALNELQQDLQMWRTILKGDGTLIGKMLAVAFLHGDLILLADLIADPSTDLNSLGDSLDPVLLPFDLKDYRIGNSFAAEFRGTAALYKTITFGNQFALSPAPPWRQRTWNALQAHFFKPDATMNMGAAMATQWIELGNTDPRQFFEKREAYRVWLKDNEPHLAPRSLYNPVGNILVTIAEAQVDGYCLRDYDVAAYQRLVYLVFQLKRQHIANADVAAFMSTHPEWSTHPVDGKPFDWNADTREIAVNTLGEHPKEQRFGLPLH